MTGFALRPGGQSEARPGFPHSAEMRNLRSGPAISDSMLKTPRWMRAYLSAAPIRHPLNQPAAELPHLAAREQSFSRLAMAIWLLIVRPVIQQLILRVTRPGVSRTKAKNCYGTSRILEMTTTRALGLAPANHPLAQETRKTVGIIFSRQTQTNSRKCSKPSPHAYLLGLLIKELTRGENRRS